MKVGAGQVVVGHFLKQIKERNMEIKENTVYNCDCLDLMKSMVEQGIVADWLIADPPYGISYASVCAKSNGTQFGNAMAKKNIYTSKEWDNQRLTKEYFDLMFKCSKNQIIFGGNYYTDYLPTTKSWVIWDKRCEDKLRNDFADCEMAWCSGGVARVFHYLYNGMLQGDMKNKDERFHPTQKPTQLIINLINYYTKENDLILDPFMGSFTTAVACHKTGRRYLGAELDIEYYEKGSKRLEQLKKQTTMFD